jgi:hypothetical protein
LAVWPSILASLPTTANSIISSLCRHPRCSVVVFNRDLKVFGPRSPNSWPKSTSRIYYTHASANANILNHNLISRIHGTAVARKNFILSRVVGSLPTSIQQPMSPSLFVPDVKNNLLSSHICSRGELVVARYRLVLVLWMWCYWGQLPKSWPS